MFEMNGSSFCVDGDGEIVAAAKSFDEDIVLFDTATLRGDRHDNLGVEIEAVYEALVMGTRDYLRKCGFKRVLIGLSGGIDSTLVACIAADAVGAENVVGIGMPGPYSSDHSLKDARELAANLGIRFEVVPISGAYDNLLSNLAPVFAEAPRDVTEENIQARLRGLTLMALSNKWNALVLTTGNKSEVAVGYCTLYGDMCGGLAPISDLPKMRVYALARHLNAHGGGELIPEASLVKAPSAELRPEQTDQDSLPPYPLLDAILEGLVERNLSVEATARRAHAPLALVKKIARQVDRAEYKRNQMAPGLKVSAKAFGSGRRIPIAQRAPL